jgi:uncharacterized protein
MVIHADPVALPIPYDDVADVCRKFDVEELSIFGSALRPADFGPGSDVDLLVKVRNDDYGPWACKLDDMERELSALIGRRVELTTRPAVEQSDNPIRKRHILSTRQVIYVA